MSSGQVNVGSGNGSDRGVGGSGGSGSGSGNLAQGTQNVPMSTLESGATASDINIAADSSPRESGDDSEDESEILEESPCGRWLKRREEVDQRDVPGIDGVHLAMDTEEGVEVVWNEVHYANLQELKSQEEKMRQVFDNLLRLDHQNIVQFHRYWIDTDVVERPRVIFITEYMSSGSLKQFLKRTKRNSKKLPLEAWRRWCTQILSALDYLHSCTPPVVHGNLTCDSIFIQHNGLVKIGSVVPDAVHYSVRHTKAADIIDQGSKHFRAPEYGAAQQLTAAVDIYAFGMCALEMAALEIQTIKIKKADDESTDTNDEDSWVINEESIRLTIESLEHELQRDMIYKCLRKEPAERPSANDMLFHPLLFEVHSLKLLAAHCLVFSPRNRTMFSETVIDAMMQRCNAPDMVMAKVVMNGTETNYKLSDVAAADKLEKFVEDVKFGVYPLTAFSNKKPPSFRSRAASPERADSVKSVTPEPVDIESRRIVNMMCSVKKIKEDSSDISMTILLRMDDKMNRQLTCQVTAEDSALDLTNELVRLGFVHVDDERKIEALLEETLRGSFANDGAAFEQNGQPLTFSATINEHPGSALKASEMQQALKAATTTATLAGLNQFERNWSVADTDPAVIAASSAAGSPLSLTMGVTEAVNPVMYMAHEQNIQQQFQQLEQQQQQQQMQQQLQQEQQQMQQQLQQEQQQMHQQLQQEQQQMHQQLQQEQHQLQQQQQQQQPQQHHQQQEHQHHQQQQQHQQQHHQQQQQHHHQQQQHQQQQLQQQQQQQQLHQEPQQQQQLQHNVQTTLSPQPVLQDPLTAVSGSPAFIPQQHPSHQQMPLSSNLPNQPQSQLSPSLQQSLSAPNSNAAMYVPQMQQHTLGASTDMGGVPVATASGAGIFMPSEPQQLPMQQAHHPLSAPATAETDHSSLQQVHPGLLAQQPNHAVTSGVMYMPHAQQATQPATVVTVPPQQLHPALQAQTDQPLPQPAQMQPHHQQQHTGASNVPLHMAQEPQLHHQQPMALPPHSAAAASSFHTHPQQS